MGWGSRLGRLGTFLIAVVALSLLHSARRRAAVPQASGSLLLRKHVVPRSVVNEIFPGSLRKPAPAETVPPSAVLKPTRSVIYANGNATMKVTISLDQYRSLRDAAASVRVTLAGYDATTVNLNNLVALVRAEDAVAKVALGWLAVEQ